MATVSIAMSPGFRLNLGENEFSYEVAGVVSLADLLNGWCSQNAPSLIERVFDKDTGCIAGTAMVLLNGRSVKSEDPKTLMVSPGDSISVMPILIGG